MKNPVSAQSPSQTSIETSGKLQIPLVEKLKSIPEIFGVRLNEEPNYEVVKKDGDRKSVV